MLDEKNKFSDSSVENCDLKDSKSHDAAPEQDSSQLLEMGDAEEGADVDEKEGESIDPLVALQNENKGLKDQVLRFAADMENLRRRTARDVADAKTYAIASFARDMLSVSDNLNRALEAIPEGARESDSGLKTLSEGVEMTERAMMAALERHGVKKIDPKGQKFDPNFHQAMFEISNSDAPDNTVQQVVQAGYVIGDRVLRPAMVGVVKGKQKDAPTDSDPGLPHS